MMHSMGTKGDPPTPLHLMYLSPCQRQSCLLFHCNRWRHGQRVTYHLKKGFTLRNRRSITQTSIDCLGQQVSLLRLAQMIETSLNCHLAYLCAMYKALALLPPEVVTTLNVPWNEKDGDGNLQLTCERKSIHIVITVSIIEGQHQWRTLVTYLFPLLTR